MRQIKSVTSKTIAIALAVYLLLVSCGISFSYIWCSQGSRWVLGTEMPPCKLANANSNCPFSAKECSHKSKANKSSDSKEQRNKKSFSLNYKFVTEANHSVSVKVFSSGKSSVFDAGAVYSFSSDFKQFLFSVHNLSNRAHPPPLLSKPLLSEIQVYRI